jgi:hypothetical protein
MDTHLGIFAGFTGTNYTNFGVNHDNPDLMLVDTLIKERRAHFMQGRNQIESVFFLTKEATGVVQMIWINQGRVDPNSATMDRPIPGCKDTRGWNENGGILSYERAVHAEDDGVSINAFLQKSATTKPKSKGVVFNLGEKPPLHSPLFDLCDTGSDAAQSWAIHNCSIHLGPCCGSGTCDADRGETPVNCPEDCSK